MKDTNNDTIIFTYVQEHSPVPLNKILEELKPKGTGFSEVTIKKRLGKMVNQGQIRRIESADFKNFGIPEKDGRVTYYASVDMADIASYFDRLFKIILSAETTPKQKISALEEVGIYKTKSILTPRKLDDLSTIVDVSEDIFNLSVEILHDYIIFKHILPSKKEDCIKKLNSALSKFRKIKKFQDTVNNVFQILAFYADNSIIEHLERDAYDGDTLRDWHRDYRVPGINKILENNRERLRTLMDNLKETGRSDIAEIIKEIRIFALQQDYLSNDARKSGGFV